MGKGKSLGMALSARLANDFWISDLINAKKLNITLYNSELPSHSV